MRGYFELKPSQQMPYKKQKVIRRIRENKKGTFLCAQVVGLLKVPLYSKRDLNPHAPSGARDFKSLVSTDSTIRASFRGKMKQKTC